MRPLKLRYRGPVAPIAPVASFLAAGNSGTIPLTVTFTDTSTNSPTSWAWVFGDGGTSTAQNPSHVYSVAGTYSVSLTATNAGGSSTSTQTNIITASSGAGVPGAVTLSIGVPVTPTVGWPTPASTLSNAVYLTWTLPSGVGPFTYTVEQSTDNVNWTTALSGVKPGYFGNGTEVRTAIPMGLTPSTAYYFRVTAVNGSGSGAVSNTVTTTTLASGSLPSTPVVTATNVSGDFVFLQWGASTNTPLDYRVEFCPTGTGQWQEEPLSQTNKTTTRSVYFDLSPSTTYDFRVRAINAVGASTWSTTVTGSTLAYQTFTNAAAVSSYGQTADDQTTEDPATASAYSGATAYVTGNVVTYLGSAYMAITETTGNLPTDTAYWQAIATTVYYFSAAGSDANAGTSAAAPFQTMDRLSNLISSGNSAAPGPVPNATLILFRRGDTFDGPAIIQSSATILMLGSYGTGTNAIPKLKWTTYSGAGTYQTNRIGVLTLLTGRVIAKHVSFEMDPANTSTAATDAVNVQSTVSGNLTLHSCEAMNAKSIGLRGDNQTGWNVKNCYIHGNVMGFLGIHSFGSNFVGNTWDNNGSVSSATTHSMYFSDGAVRVVVRGNLFLNTVGNVGNYGAVFHGPCAENIVDQNKFSGCNNGLGVSNGYVAGINTASTKEFFAHFQVTRNLFENSGYGTGQNQGYGIISDSIRHSLIANNTFRNQKLNDITISYSASSPDDLVSIDNEIASNSFVSTSTVGICINIMSASTLDTRIRDNAFYLTSSGAYAWQIDSAVLGTEVTLDHNQYFDASGVTTHLMQWLGTNYASLSAFKAAVAGMEAGSAQGDPLFTNTTGNFALQAGSPCKLTGTPITNVTIDFAGTTRSVTTPSIGAYE